MDASLTLNGFKEYSEIASKLSGKYETNKFCS